jgi:predicted SAM-dependent methyltransferase
MLRLNIGCGRDYKEGWINTDISREVKAEAYFDIRTEKIRSSERTGSEVPDGAVEQIYISGVLEQIGENEHLIHAMNECHRVLRKGGVMEVVVPNAQFAVAHQDPMDVRKFTRGTFPYFIEGMRQHDFYGSVYGFKGWERFDVLENERHIMIIKMYK